MPRRMVSVTSRFWRKVERGADCWFWKGARTTAGYGAIAARGKVVAAHRLSWSLAKGVPLEGLRVLHLCANRLCVRPEHLHVVTPSAAPTPTQHTG